jgi:hypothetical protein
MTPELTPAQKATLKASILADGTLAAAVAAGDDSTVAAAYNAAAAPAFVVWKSNVSIGAVGDAINATELAGLTTLNTTRLQTIAQYAPTGFNFSLADRRQAFNDIFSGAGGTVTRPALLALWKRNATRAEKALATGTGSDATPATLTSEGNLSPNEVSTILRG